ncbi:MAG: hypothetical protein QGG67_06110 [Gammaproteobacteria bacterium]|jgi:hypothetical protein|nr:hypothetical protein [Gammaproteobacteria bacterium]MDP7454976.1 hypothetical protein [Gammaproteobacteria bacterium]HJO10522.1 hypothetical protein [Gammaproteobacteria bacterium]|tara:strand:+ start:1823 stop:2719 length:897 start_codon:yes stop_codon:yes gene_type:complete
MPTNQNHNEPDLSALLNQTEPPESPDHLDDLILQYAHDNVPESGTQSSWQMLTLSRQWLNQNWISAMAAFSVAVIAVSVTLQSPDTTLLDQTIQSQSTELQFLAVNENAGVAQTSAITIAPARDNAGGADLNSVAEPELQIATSIATAEPAARQIASSNSLALRRESDPLVLADDTVADSVLEEELSADTPVAAIAATAALVAGDQDIRSLLTNDEESSAALMVLLDRVLIRFDQTEVVSPPLTTDVAEQARLLMNAFNQLTDSAAANSRYAAARADFTAFELPESLEAAIELLDLIR